MSNQQLQQMPVVWLQGASCSGCSVSLLNSAAPRIANVLLEELVPDKHVQVVFHPTIMAASGQAALEILHDTEQRSDGYVLILEGGLPEKIPYIGGTTDDGEEISLLDCFADLAANAIAVVAVGSCAAFGGVPAATPNPSGCKTASEVLAERGVATPVVNVSGCPPHPDWIVGTLVHLMLNGVPKPDDLDDWGRPRAFFGSLIHENCPRRADFDAGKFAFDHFHTGRQRLFGQQTRHMHSQPLV
jgi:hydrogenase small subunit